MAYRPIWEQRDLCQALSPAFSSQAFTLTTMRHCADWWNVQRFESESSVQIKAICFIWLQLTSLMTHGYPLLKENTT